MAARAESRSPAAEGQAPPGVGRDASFLGGAAGRAGAPAPRVPRTARRRHWPLRPHRRFKGQPSPPRTWTHGPACAHPQPLRRTPGSHSPGSGGLAGSLLPTATASGSGSAAGEHRAPGPGGHSLGQGDSGTPQRHHRREPFPVAPTVPTGSCGPSMKHVARE